MRKQVFKALVDNLKRRKRGFSKLIDNPAGSKFRKHTSKLSRRGADGTMR